MTTGGSSEITDIMKQASRAELYGVTKLVIIKIKSEYYHHY